VVGDLKQKRAFSEGEGDAWFDRNRAKLGRNDDEVKRVVESLQLQPKRILEIGCSNGYRLERLRARFKAECAGIDPSQEAIADGKGSYPGLSLETGTADDLPFPDGGFDLVIFGFCLYLCDPADHLCIAAEADRVLTDPGYLVIYDFIAPTPRRQPYSHHPGLHSHKMEFSRLFTGSPAYRLLTRKYLEHGSAFTFDERESISIDVLRKDSSQAFA
jgi:SAM-dependent methyltransferase